jgi:hypothetical protein
MGKRNGASEGRIRKQRTDRTLNISVLEELPVDDGTWIQIMEGSEKNFMIFYIRP